MKHANISFFIPHEGCPQTCSFCNQRAISGQVNAPTAQDITTTCEIQLKNNLKLTGENTEIAFFGGSFTAIDPNYMQTLLEAAHPFVKKGRVTGIRISTRPDCINTHILTTLKQYGVTAIELGAQSMSDTVLTLNNRGHTAVQVREAGQQIKAHGFSLGLQMMLGLLGDSEARSLHTAEEFICLAPATVRIYPTLILENTQLHRRYLEGTYTPLRLLQAVDTCTKLLPLFERANMQVIKLGLHPDREMQKSLVAGPFHPAFKQLVESKLYLKELVKLLQNKPKGEYTVFVNKGQISNCIGNKGENLSLLKEQGYILKIRESQKTLVNRGVLL